ncbi:MFS transporter [Inquilinus sp. Marseille-Q2685]|uniref:MFS transporter n=1 Tax=Inquilinus sp. Marseille-Q2685 TaxID=2866581 RepID=UPI001CE487C7|nr:MFS transporter [Inquilinus sp. Marseille-Q2685]
MNLTQSEIHTIVLGALLALFLSALDQTIVATALPSIGRELGDFELISWVVTAYLLTSTCATPILGKLSDLYGRRLMLLGCLVVFLAASALCALSTSMTMLIASRALQGLGGGGLLTLAQTVIADVVAPRERGRYAAYFATVWAGSALIGPTLGGALTQYAGWPWIFWINLPLGLLALGIVDRSLRKLPVPRVKARIDFVSIALLTLGTVALLLGLSWGGTAFPWASLPVVAAAAVAILGGWLFFRRQSRVEEPILPPRFLGDAVVGPVLTSVFLAFGGYLVLAVLAPTYLQVALQAGTGEVGLMMIPLMGSTTVTASLSGRYITRTGTYRRPPMIGLPVAIVAVLALAAVATHATPLVASGLLMIVGLGVGPIFPASMVAAQNAAAVRDLGAVTGAIGFSRALGGAILVAAGSALVLGLIVAWSPSVASVSGLEELVRRPLGEAERGAIARAFAVLFATVAAVFALSLVTYLRVEHRPLRSQTHGGTDGGAG